MGWTSSHRSSNQSVKDYLIEEINETGKTATFKVLDIAIVKRNTAYLAVKRTSIDTGKSEVFAMVILIRYGRGQFNITTKEMGEDMGPFYYDCPARILDILTPTDHTEAVLWRERCRANLANCESLKKELATAKEGDVFKFGSPVRFTKGTFEQMTFHRTEKRRHVFMVGPFVMYASFDRLMSMKRQYGLEVTCND